jgi:hypothetical protein
MWEWTCGSPGRVCWPGTARWAPWRACGAHRTYLHAVVELGKAHLHVVVVAELDKALDGVATEKGPRRLLDTLDAAMRATEDKRRVLGLPPPADHAVEDGVVAPLRGGRECAGGGRAGEQEGKRRKEMR